RSGRMEPEQAAHAAVTDVLQRLTRDDLLRFAVIVRVPMLPQRRIDWFVGATFDVLFDAWEDQEEQDLKQLWPQLRKDQQDVLWMLRSEVDARSHIDTLRSGERRPGRPRGAISNRPLRNFVWRLLTIADAAGGKLTLEKNMGRGSLIK